MLKEKTPLNNGGQKLFEVNQFQFAPGRKLVQNSKNTVAVLTTKQILWVQEIRTLEQINGII